VIASDIGCYGDGALFFGKLPDSWNGNKNLWLENLVARAHRKGVNVSICVGGDEHFADATGENFDTFVGNIVNFVHGHALDGVDIDWEFPEDSTQWSQCIALLTALRDSLPPCKRISIALPVAHPGNTNFYPAQTPSVPEQIWNAVDAIHLMTYDEGGGLWKTHSEANSAINHVYLWELWGMRYGKNLDKEKLVAGCAFYGYKKDDSGNTLWGEENKVSYTAYSGAGNFNPGDVAEDVKNKVNHCYDNGYGGVMIWELGYDANIYTTPKLLNAIWNANNAKGGYSVAEITTQPARATTVVQGDISDSLNVAASTKWQCLRYQWYSGTTDSNKSGTAIPGATDACFPIPASLTTGAYYYFCQINTSVGAVRSNVAKVMVMTGEDKNN
jgi:GH18 family chitinase